MKLLSVRLARSIWLVPSYFLNPTGISLRPALEAIKARYSFLKSPLDSPIPPAPKEGYKFENGAFNTKNGTTIDVNMTSHDDGIVVDTRSSTENGDLFLEDLMNWVSKEYGVPSVSDLPIKRIYVSELNVTLKNAPVIFNPKLAPFLDAVSAEIGSDIKGKTYFHGFNLGTDPTRASPAIFRLEREVNTAPDENRFYSFSPTHTATHLQLLEMLEQLAT